MEPDILKQLKLLAAGLKTVQREIRELKDAVSPLLPKTDKIMSLAETVEFLRMSNSKVRKLMYAGEIPYSKKGRRVLFSQNQLIMWLNR